MSLTNSDSKVIQGRFHLVKKLGAGSFGEIFEAIDLKSNKAYACKAENIRTKHPQLKLEWTIYRALQGSKNFVHVYGFLQHGQHFIMIMDKLGESLEQLFNQCNRRFSIKTVCLIALQILDRIKELHEKDYLHRDIKPDNFLIGLNDSYQSKKAQQIYMIDLGLGKKWIEQGRHIPEKHDKRLIGTPRYASVNTHFGHEQSRRDDLESLGYMLMYFAKGQLPWQGLRGNTKEEKYQKIGQKKKETPLSELCRGYPDEFRQYLQLCRNLQFEQLPPYMEFQQLFHRVLTNPTYCPNNQDCLFDWQLTSKNRVKQIQQQKRNIQHRNRIGVLPNNNSPNNNNNNNAILQLPSLNQLQTPKQLPNGNSNPIAPISQFRSEAQPDPRSSNVATNLQHNIMHTHNNNFNNLHHHHHHQQYKKQYKIYNSTPIVNRNPHQPGMVSNSNSININSSPPTNFHNHSRNQLSTQELSYKSKYEAILSGYQSLQAKNDALNQQIARLQRDLTHKDRELTTIKNELGRANLQLRNNSLYVNDQQTPQRTVTPHQLYHSYGHYESIQGTKKRKLNNGIARRR